MYHYTKDELLDKYDANSWQITQQEAADILSQLTDNIREQIAVGISIASEHGLDFSFGADYVEGVRYGHNQAYETYWRSSSSNC